jgi:hypothetical protein
VADADARRRLLDNMLEFAKNRRIGKVKFVYQRILYNVSFEFIIWKLEVSMSSMTDFDDLQAPLRLMLRSGPFGYLGQIFLVVIPIHHRTSNLQ